MNVRVIVPAAGLGTRMAGAQGTASAPKQFGLLAGIPILVHTVRAFSSLPAITSVHVAVRASERARTAALLGEYGLGESVGVVEGGDTRQESVSRALRTISAAPEDIFLVHDAVRPLIAQDLIEKTIEAARRHGAAIVALPATDTIKQVERTADGARITATIPRENIVQAQTPQGFRASLLLRAFAEAEADGFCGTDEASIVERAGHEVVVVAGSLRNLKITQPADLELAEFFLAQSAAQ
jgi:2-C-methyl-D-erythritol 4-phosphate cytidylyltransferase